MNAKLNQIQDWLRVARRAGWSVKDMASYCRVSKRSLERHFIKKMGLTPKEWLKGCRQRQAVELLRDGSSIKETAAELGYKHSTHLARDFKNHWGCCPTQFNPNRNTKTSNVRSVAA